MCLGEGDVGRLALVAGGALRLLDQFAVDHEDLHDLLDDRDRFAGERSFGDCVLRGLLAGLENVQDFDVGEVRMHIFDNKSELLQIQLGFVMRCALIL